MSNMQIQSGTPYPLNFPATTFTPSGVCKTGDGLLGDPLDSVGVPDVSVHSLSAVSNPTSNPAKANQILSRQAAAAEQITGQPKSRTESVQDAAAGTGTVAGPVGDAANGTLRAAAAASAVGRTLEHASHAARYLGPVGAVVAGGAQVAETSLEVYSTSADQTASRAEKSQKVGHSVFVGGAKIILGAGLATAGVIAGASLGPGGMIAGAVAGGFVGDQLGEAIGGAIGDTRVGQWVGEKILDWSGK